MSPTFKFKIERTHDMTRANTLNNESLHISSRASIWQLFYFQHYWLLRKLKNFRPFYRFGDCASIISLFSQKAIWQPDNLIDLLLTQSVATMCQVVIGFRPSSRIVITWHDLTMSASKCLINGRSRCYHMSKPTWPWSNHNRWCFLYKGLLSFFQNFLL